MKGVLRFKNVAQNAIAELSSAPSPNPGLPTMHPDSTKGFNFNEVSTLIQAEEDTASFTIARRLGPGKFFVHKVDRAQK